MAQRGLLQAVNPSARCCRKVSFHFQYDTVCGYRKAFTRLVPIIDEIVYLLQRLYLLHALADLEAPGPCDLQALLVPLGRQFFA